MRWKSDNHRDRRIIKRFAWFPIRCNDGYTYWLEHYWSGETHIRDYDGAYWCTDFASKDYQQVLNWMAP
jgi:hypothetical protein